MVNIIVVFPKLEDAKNIRNLLARNGYSVIGVCCTGAQVLQITDNLEDGIVICGYRFNDMMYADLRESLASSFQMLLVASMHILESCDIALEYYDQIDHGYCAENSADPRRYGWGKTEFYGTAVPESRNRRLCIPWTV